MHFYSTVFLSLGVLDIWRGRILSCGGWPGQYMTVSSVAGLYPLDARSIPQVVQTQRFLDINKCLLGGTKFSLSENHHVDIMFFNHEHNSL